MTSLADRVRLQGVWVLLVAEVERRVAGEEPDSRFDPLIDVILDFCEEASEWLARTKAAAS